MGSNKGDRLNYLRSAVKEISNHKLCSLNGWSSIYETKPYGEINQDYFLNAAIRINSEMDIRSLFRFLQETEKMIGRQRSFKWGPREIDLDLLYFDDIICSDEKISLPHPGIQFRDFVIVPLNEIAPDFMHPALKKKNSDICKEISESYIVARFPGRLII